MTRVPLTRFSKYLLPIILTPLVAQALPTTQELEKYIVIAGGQGSDGTAFDSSDGEWGADQEVVDTNGLPNPSTSGPNYSFPNSSLDLSFTDGRWVKSSSNDTVIGNNEGDSDFLEGAKRLAELPDYSGNVAITHSSGKAQTENSDYFATMGIQCAGGYNSCFGDNGDKNNDSWIQPDKTVVKIGKQSSGDGVTANVDFSDLLSEMSQWRTYLDNLTSGIAITNFYSGPSTNLQSYNNKSGNPGTLTIDLDSLTANSDNIVVIDIDVTSSDFEFTNSDVILHTDEDRLAVFRVIGEKTVKFNNSSIMIGEDCALEPTVVDGCLVDELGAIFHRYKSWGNNTVTGESYNLSNAILGGIGLWDFGDQNGNYSDKNYINISNAQGCAQFISGYVDVDNARFNRCALGTPDTPDVPVPAPAGWMFFLAGLGFIAWNRIKKSS